MSGCGEHAGTGRTLIRTPEHRATLRQHVATRLWIVLGHYPALFPAYIRLKDRLTGNCLAREALFRDETELVLEGFPRSANTFALVAFQRAQSRTRVIAHHLHAASQIIHGVQGGRPVLLLVREPCAAVGSLLIRCPELSVREGLWYYCRFHSRIDAFLDGCVVARYETVTTDFGRVVRTLNARFGTDFDVPPVDDAFTQACFERIAEIGKGKGKGDVFDMTVAMPTAAREAQKAKLAALLASPSYTGAVRRARGWYRRATAQAV
jgi:hypothetical protein